MAVDDDYLKKYLTASGPSTSAKKKKKSKKSKTDSSQPGLIIADDDLSGFHNPSKPTDDDDDDFVPQIVGGARSADFRKTKKSGWVTVGAAAPTNADQAAADAVFAAAQAERDAANAALEAADAPVVVGEDGEDVAGAGGGKLTGLQSGSQVAKAMKAKADAERREFETMDATVTGKGQETVYRDGTGRIVNVAKLKAQAQRKAEEEEAKKRKAAEEAKGDVQRAEKKARREQLEEAKFMTLARYADDEELNAELKEQDRWNDPLAGLVGSKKKGKSVTGKPLYKGAAPPNRYGIRPGYRWDGVDRSNGFEKEYFAAQNRRKNMQELQHAWEMDE